MDVVRGNRWGSSGRYHTADEQQKIQCDFHDGVSNLPLGEEGLFLTLEK